MAANLGLGTYRIDPKSMSLAVAMANMDADTAWVDTAPNYLGGLAQELLAPILVRFPKVSVSSKVGFLSTDAAIAATHEGVLSSDEVDTEYCLRPRYVEWQGRRNCAELRKKKLDVLFAHNPERVDGDVYTVLKGAFGAMEALVSEGTIKSYGVATWDGFLKGRLRVKELDKVAAEAAGTRDHHLKAIQLPVSLVMSDAFESALEGKGPIAEAAELGWDVFASAPLFGGELPELAHRDLTALIAPALTVPAACILAVASCPGVTRVLLSASTPSHWLEAYEATIKPTVPAPALRKVFDVLSSD
ncbi:aldo/keto reductase [Streptomyces sp. NPDC005918]|uniref:aldo/keto reductase n=1 Tax=Streptomyces sp. NPDC005918 TaxID=3155454 RepID=UPI0033D940AF